MSWIWNYLLKTNKKLFLIRVPHDICPKAIDDCIELSPNLRVFRFFFLVAHFQINEYKCKLETVEMDMKSKVLQWEKHERFMDAQIAYFAKALQESKNEKNDLNEQMSHLKNCLRQSLDSFQRLVRSKTIKMLRSVRLVSLSVLKPMFFFRGNQCCKLKTN